MTDDEKRELDERLLAVFKDYVNGCRAEGDSLTEAVDTSASWLMATAASACFGVKMEREDLDAVFEVAVSLAVDGVDDVPAALGLDAARVRAPRPLDHDPHDTNSCRKVVQTAVDLAQAHARKIALDGGGDLEGATEHAGALLMEAGTILFAGLKHERYVPRMAYELVLRALYDAVDEQEAEDGDGDDDDTDGGTQLN